MRDAPPVARSFRPLSLDDRSLRDAEGLCTTLERNDVERLVREAEREAKEQ